MSNPAALNTAAAGFDAVADQLAGPQGPKPRRALSRRNIILYGTLLVVALYYLLPLYVMIVTSLKGMPEIRLGNIFSPPMEITFEPWVKAWATACTGLNRAVGRAVDRDRIGERLRAGQLAVQGR
jgi:glucose/mannose transport system permease protein